MENHSERVNFIWESANLIRDSFKRSKYQDVSLPLTILRQIDCVLAASGRARRGSPTDTFSFVSTCLGV